MSGRQMISINQRTFDPHSPFLIDLHALATQPKVHQDHSNDSVGNCKSSSFLIFSKPRLFHVSRNFIKGRQITDALIATRPAPLTGDLKVLFLGYYLN